MSRTVPKIAILLAFAALLMMGVASDAEAKGGASAAAAAAQRMSKGAQVRLNRMKVKMALRPRGAMAQKTRRQIRLGKRQLMRAMGRREIGLHGSEAERARSAFARGNIGQRFKAASLKAPVVLRNDSRGKEELDKLGLKQRTKMRLAAKRRANKAFRRLRSNDD